MKRIIFLSGIAVFIIASVSCKKKTNPGTTEVNPEPIAVTKYPNYSQLKTGNYWIYERFQINEDGSLTDLNMSDSCYIEKDTIIRSKTFHKLVTYNFLFARTEAFILCDSLHYTIDPSGNKVFSSQDFTTIFNNYYDVGANKDTIYHFQTKMDDKDLTVTVPAGSFITSAAKTTCTMSPGYAPPSLLVRSIFKRYAKNVGLVIEREYFYATSPLYTEKRLVRYHVN